MRRDKNSSRLAWTDGNPVSLKSRHIQFIALGGTIGTGLFLGIGKAFTQAGPLSLLLGYSFTGVAIFAMVSLPVDNGHARTKLISSIRCNLWERWLPGYHYPVQFLNFAHVTLMTPWVLLSAGM